MRIYVASSWRNNYQPSVVTNLRADGHDVYDFKDSDGFRWSEIDGDWLKWSPSSYIKNLTHPLARRGFNRDMLALTSCELCVAVMPFGVSSALESGYAKGSGKPVIVYVPELREPDLMIKMADLVTDNFGDIIDFINRVSRLP